MQVGVLLKGAAWLGNGMQRHGPGLQGAQHGGSAILRDHDFEDVTLWLYWDYVPWSAVIMAAPRSPSSILKPQRRFLPPSFGYHLPAGKHEVHDQAMLL